MRYTACVDSVSVVRSISFWDEQVLHSPPAVSLLRPCRQPLTLSKTTTPIDWRRRKARKLLWTWPRVNQHSEAYYPD